MPQKSTTAFEVAEPSQPRQKNGKVVTFMVEMALSPNPGTLATTTSELVCATRRSRRVHTKTQPGVAVVDVQVEETEVIELGT